MRSLRVSILLLLLLIAAPLAYIVLNPAPVISYVLSQLGCRNIRVENVSVRSTEMRADLVELECGTNPPTFKANLRGISVSYNNELVFNRQVSSISVDSVDLSTPWALQPRQATSPALVQLPSVPVLPFTQLAIKSMNFNALAHGVAIQLRDGVILTRDLDLGRYRIDIGGADGTVGDALFKNFSGNGFYDIRGATPATFQATLDQFDYGVSLTKLSAKGELRPDLTLSFERAQVTFLNAQFSTKDVVLKNGGRVGKTPLVFKGLDLATVATLYGTESLKMSGIVDGKVPLSVDTKGVTVKDGILDARTPGGVIEYTGSIGLDTSEPRGALVASVLKHINYSLLHANVNYSRSGDLVLAVTLRGRSPHLNTGQDVNVNLNIEENLPAFLRTLRLARGEEDFRDLGAKSQ